MKEARRPSPTLRESRVAGPKDGAPEHLPASLATRIDFAPLKTLHYRDTTMCKKLYTLLPTLVTLGCAASDLPAPIVHTAPPSAPPLDTSFFQDCAFVCVDIQPMGRTKMTDEQLPKGWRRAGFSADDVNAANDYALDVAHPNARRIADACRELGLPMIFIHWGCLLPDGMDLDPEVRKSFLNQHGPNPDKWGHRIGDPGSRPAEILGVRDGEYVIPKSAQDAFASSNIEFVLANLGVRNIVFVGGHTGACLGKSAASARRLGYRTLCVKDATFDARESARIPNLRATGYDYIVTTEELLTLAKAVQSNEKQ